MIVRFSLYGFLKNLRLFEAFLVLALLEHGLVFFAIGVLIAIREVTVNLLEIPSGLLADNLGRKRCMVVSMACYLASYFLLGITGGYGWLVLAMILYGFADAFRSGTHKAIIYAWIRKQGRESERTRIYGYTRSWSKIGSAVSALIAAAIVFFSQQYTAVFLWSMLPAGLNLVNLATYPRWLDDEIKTDPRPGISLRQLCNSLRLTITRPRMRRLFIDSAAMEGTYAVVKDYLQPVIQYSALATPLLLTVTGRQRTALLCGGTYALMFILTSIASRQAHRWEAWSRDSETAIRRLYLASFACYLPIGVGLALGWAWLAIGGFMVMGLVQNLWRPIHVGRFDRDGLSHLGATSLSVESQAKTLTAAVLAPAVGAIVDAIHPSQDASLTALVPISFIGMIVLAGFLFNLYRFHQSRHQTTRSGQSKTLT